MWKGVLRNGCYDAEGGLYALDTVDATQFYLCSLDSPSGQHCPTNATTGADMYTCMRDRPNYYHG